MKKTLPIRKTTASIIVRVDTDIKETLVAMAEDDGRSLESMMRVIIRKYLQAVAK
jgi:predicted HicB family RNase H-like nuclease